MSTTFFILNWLGAVVSAVGAVSLIGFLIIVGAMIYILISGAKPKDININFKKWSIIAVVLLSVFILLPTEQTLKQTSYVILIENSISSVVNLLDR